MRYEALRAAYDRSNLELAKFNSGGASDVYEFAVGEEKFVIKDLRRSSGEFGYLGPDPEEVAKWMEEVFLLASSYVGSVMAETRVLKGKPISNWGSGVLILQPKFVGETMSDLILEKSGEKAHAQWSEVEKEIHESWWVMQTGRSWRRLPGKVRDAYERPDTYQGNFIVQADGQIVWVDF